MSEDTLIYEEWEMKLQLEQGLKVLESGALKRIALKQWHTKKYTHDQALALFAELNIVEPLDQSSREILEIELANYEQAKLDEIKRKESLVERKEAGREVRKNTKELQAKSKAAKERGQDLFNTFNEIGELDNTPIGSMTAAEQFLANKADEEE